MSVEANKTLFWPPGLLSAVPVTAAAHGGLLGSPSSSISPGPFAAHHHHYLSALYHQQQQHHHHQFGPASPFLMPNLPPGSGGGSVPLSAPPVLEQPRIFNFPPDPAMLVGDKESLSSSLLKHPPPGHHIYQPIPLTMHGTKRKQNSGSADSALSIGDDGNSGNSSKNQSPACLSPVDHHHSQHQPINATRSAGLLAPPPVRDVSSRRFTFPHQRPPGSSRHEHGNKADSNGKNQSGKNSSAESDSSTGSKSPGSSVESLVGGGGSGQGEQYRMCYKAGSIILLANGSWKLVENLETGDFLACASASPNLRVDQSVVMKLEERPSTGSVYITFAVGPRKASFTVEAPSEHPFFVYNRGWSSCSPEKSLTAFGLKCHMLQVGDNCISLVSLA